MTAKRAPSKKTLAAKTVRPVVPAKHDRSLQADPPSMDEPDLQEMLRDPIMERLMTSDGITKSQLMTLVAAARVRIESSRRRYAD